MHCIRPFPGLVIGYSNKENGPITTAQEVDDLVAPHVQHSMSILPVHEHGVQVVTIDERNATLPTADILLTAAHGIVLAHQFADCVPVIIYDPRRRTVCFAHAGWRGLIQGAVPISLYALLAATGSDRSECWMWIGPCIHKESYLMSHQPVQAQFPIWEECITQEEDQYRVDLPGYVSKAAIAAGMDERKIFLDDYDTYAHPEVFFSHTRYKQTHDTAEKGNFVVVCWLE